MKIFKYEQINSTRHIFTPNIFKRRFPTFASASSFLVFRLIPTLLFPPTSCSLRGCRVTVIVGAGY